MKKVLGAIAGFAFAVAAFAVMGGVSSPVSATSCTEGTSYNDFEGSYSGRDTMTVSTKDDKKLCNDVKVNFASFTIHNTYNGKGFKNNPTALPQSQFYNKTVTLKKGTNGKTTVTVSVPDACTDYQIDAYLGEVQTTITTNEGFIGTNAIISQLFQRTKTDCKVPVCNPSTGEIIKVDEKDASKYKPVDDVACQGLKVCDFTTKTIKTIKGYQFDSNTMSKDVNAKECQPAPNKVNVCNPATGEIITVDEADASKYKPVDDEACKETPGKGGTTPEELPSTGPAEAISALLGTGSLAGAGTAYVRSRRALRK